MKWIKSLFKRARGPVTSVGTLTLAFEVDTSPINKAIEDVERLIACANKASTAFGVTYIPVLSDLLAEQKRTNDLLAALIVQSSSSAAESKRIADLLIRVTRDGESIYTTRVL